MSDNRTVYLMPVYMKYMIWLDAYFTAVIHIYRTLKILFFHLLALITYNLIFQCVYFCVQVIQVKVDRCWFGNEHSGSDYTGSCASQHLWAHLRLCVNATSPHTSVDTLLSPPLLSFCGSKYRSSVPTAAPTHLTPDRRDLTVTRWTFQLSFQYNIQYY